MDPGWSLLGGTHAFAATVALVLGDVLAATGLVLGLAPVVPEPRAVVRRAAS